MHPPGDDRQPSQSDNLTAPIRETLLKLQIAEYSALMSRGNSFMAFYVGITGVIVAITAFAVQEWLKTNEFTVLWLGGIAVLAALNLYANWMVEDYLLVSYLENELRTAVVRNSPGLQSESFWQYEPFLSRWRGHENWWGVWLIPSGIATLFFAGVAMRRASLVGDLWWIILNAVLLVALLARTYQQARLRKTFTHRTAPSQETA